MRDHKALLCISCAILVALLTSCSGGDKTDASSRATHRATPSGPTTLTPSPSFSNGEPPCKEPKAVEFPDWLPDDLPLPQGTYAYKNLAPVGGYKRALFVLPQGTRKFIKLVLREWPKAGYALGRGDAEPGEIEDDFRKPPAVGAFKANDVYCTPGYTVMYLIWAVEGPQEIPIPTPSATGSPLNGKK